MQSVTAAFTAEEKDRVRTIAQSVQVSWKKDFRPGITFFTIGVSTIGGNDIIPGEAGVQSAWNRYLYFDESDQVLDLDYERELNMPTGGLVKALADVRLDNTSGRYLPRYMGGNSEIFTAIEPRKPIIINTGFKVDGVDQPIPQFVGVTTKSPRINVKNKTVELQAADFIDFLQNKYLDETTMFTGLRTDEVIENILSDLGYSTSQYELDTGLNIIKFGLFETGKRFSDIIDEVVKAEYGHFYQDEEGVLRFENRQHWNNSPFTEVQKVITTAMVINAEAPNEDHIINVVEVRGKPREKQTNQVLWEMSGYAGAPVLEITAGADAELWVNYNDPILAVTSPTGSPSSIETSYFVANNQPDNSGTDKTSSVYLKSITNFAQASKLVFHNNDSGGVYITRIALWGRPARRTGDVYYRGIREPSITAFEERPFLIESPFIQEASWAQSYAEMILEDFADPENLQELTIRAIPELQLGDLVSWQGRHFRVYGIEAELSADAGFVQKLKLVQRTAVQYFRIGISTIGGTDSIAP